MIDKNYVLEIIIARNFIDINDQSSTVIKSNEKFFTVYSAGDRTWNILAVRRHRRRRSPLHLELNQSMIAGRVDDFASLIQHGVVHVHG